MFETMSSTIQQFLTSFDLLPDSEKRKLAREILRRTFVRSGAHGVDEAEFAALYAEFAADDVDLAEEGIEDYARGLLAEDGP